MGVGVGVFDPIQICEEIAKIVDQERVMNVDQIIEKIRERFSEKDKIKEAFFAGRKSVIDNKKPSMAWIEYDRLNTK